MITTEAPEIRRLFRTGAYTKSELASMFHCHPQTIANVLKREEGRDIYRRANHPDKLIISPYRDIIRRLLKNGDMTSSSIHEHLKGMGASLSYSTVCKEVRQIKKELDLSVIRFETSPGQQAQADWANFPEITTDINGIERPVYAFFLVLGFSRMKYVEFVTDMTTKTLIRSIENALSYVGGVPKEILFDNMPQVVNRCINPRKSGKLKRELVPEFTAFADYYGFDIVLARIRRPQEKGKVERFVGHFKNSFLPLLGHKTGHDLQHLNRMAKEWCDDANHRIHGTTGKRPALLLHEENLRELPRTPYYENDTIQVQRDGSISYHGQIYQTDPGLSGCSGRIIDLQNTLFAFIDGRYFLLGKRDLPVYIRRRYSGTTQAVRQKHSKKPSESNKLPVPHIEEITIDWRRIIEQFRTE